MARIRVRIDTPRFGFVKRHDDGSVDFVSPLPCPFAYGSVPGTRAADGDREDAVVLGSRARRGDSVEGELVAIVRFVDAGAADDKLVVSTRGGLTVLDRAVLRGFFALYAPAKRLVHRMRGDRAETSFRGIEDA